MQAWGRGDWGVAPFYNQPKGLACDRDKATTNPLLACHFSKLQHITIYFRHAPLLSFLNGLLLPLSSFCCTLFHTSVSGYIYFYLSEATTMPSLPSLFRRRPSPPSPPLLELQDLGSAIIEGAEYVPKSRKPADKFAYYPDISKVQEGADNQSQSRFFNMLPVEVRQLIYQDIWALSGLTQHIYIANGSYTHCPCLIDHNAPDKRQTELDLLWPELPRVGHGDFRSESPEWRRRLLSTWCNHWPCEEAAARNATSEAAPSSSFLPMLLTSRKM